jgi:hypothetical protein
VGSGSTYHHSPAPPGRTPADSDAKCIAEKLARSVIFPLAILFEGYTIT